jgi:hypothetical protein
MRAARALAFLMNLMITANVKKEAERTASKPKEPIPRRNCLI